VLLVAGATASGCASHEVSPEELQKSAERLHLKVKPGMDVGEIGAGDGAMTVAVAKAVGPQGRVYATEIDTNKLARIRARVEKAGLRNVRVIQADDDTTNLPDACCDVIFMTAVYHHFTHPTETDTSIYRALRPGGVLAIQDFRPTIWLAPWTPEGVPSNRGGHGVPEQIVIGEVTAAGFQETSFTDRCPDDAFRHYYCVAFRKPVAPQTSSSR
jgi:ubiquinone/menaquinone biosynthesis C-methylase UbiE